MLITDRLRPKHDSVSMDNLLLLEVKGITKKDKFVLFFLKNMYLGLRVSSMFVLSKKKRDFSNIERGISFKGFLYKSVKFLGMDNLVLKVNVPKYGFQAYCRIEDEFNDFVLMTQHEHDLIDRFFPKEGDVAIDIGAQIGLYTITSSKHVGQNGKVIAIGPDPADFEILNRNIKSNNLTNVMPFNYIAYSKEMEMVLVEYLDNTVPVHINTLDNLL